MKPLKEKISITIDNDLLATLKTLAENDDRLLSQYINIALKEHINKTALNTNFKYDKTCSISKK